MANACGRLSLMVEDSAESVVDDIMERVEEHVVERKLLSMIDFDRSKD